MDRPHVRTDLGLHAFQRPGILVAAPIACSRDEDRRLLNLPAREKLFLSIAKDRSPVPVQSILETVSTEFLRVNHKLVVRQPIIDRDIGGGRHVLGDRFSHSICQIHNVVGGHFRHYAPPTVGQLRKSVQ